MFSGIKQIGIVVALSIALGGCLIVHTVNQEQLYSTQYVSWAAYKGSYPVEINGNPLGSSTLADEKLLSAMQMPHWIAPRNFHLMPHADRGTGHRLVLVFNPASPYTSGESICASAYTRTSAPGTRMKIIGALCSGKDNVSRATAEGDVQPGLRDQNFVGLLNSLLAGTMPARNKNHDSTDCRIPPCS